MDNIKFSLCASAFRPSFWLETYLSLQTNSIPWEIVYVGPKPPTFELPKNFIYIQSNVKPSQCYEIAFRTARGELIHWMADDCTYPVSAIDKMYWFWQSFHNEKLITAFRTIEDDRDITDVHRLRGRDMSAPRMAPFGVISKKLFHELGGYDRRFICGQSENDIVMRVYEIGGELQISDIPVFVHHNKNHHASGTVFRSGFYHEDRKVLENSWIKDGVIQSKRLDPVEPFEDKDILIKTQSQKGIWE
jgi:hypothetical protein